MPRVDRIDPGEMAQEDAALSYARLQLREAQRHLEHGLVAQGIAALYDSLLFGMHHYIARHERCAMVLEGADLWDAVALYHALARAGVFEDPFLFHRFSQIVERVLWQEPISIDARAMLAEAESILTKLGVMPTGESAPTGVH